VALSEIKESEGVARRPIGVAQQSQQARDSRIGLLRRVRCGRLSEQFRALLQPYCALRY
jgi:hypothetical protein